jgi:hypothetical protein
LDLSPVVFLGFFASRFDFLWPLAHHCLPALASSSVVLVWYRGEVRKLPKLDSGVPRRGFSDTATTTKFRDELASIRVGRGGEFDRDCNRLAVAPLIETVQAICKIFESRVPRQRERKRTVLECHRHVAWLRLIVIDI